MTRSTLRRSMRRIYCLIGLLLTVSVLAKLAEHIPFLRGNVAGEVLKDTYELLRDMSLLIATAGVAYISNIYQRRQGFIESLKFEWREIIAAKTAMLTFMHKADATHDDYVKAQMCLSETIDNMRVVYRNVGETDDLIGLYPYAPLHDMRRVLQTLDPRDPAAAAVDRKLARDTALRCFYALRDEYLTELDLEEPDYPLLLSGARRLAKPGAQRRARDLQGRQIKEHFRDAKPDDPSDVLLKALYEKEQSKNGQTR